MTYYHLPTDTERHPARLERKLSDGAMLGPPETGWSPELAQLCGFVPVTPATRPADTATHTSTRSVTRTGDTVAEVWTVVAKSAETLAAEQLQANRATIEARTATLIAQMNAITATTGTLTGAQLSGAVRQIAAGLRGIVRLTQNMLDATD